MRKILFLLVLLVGALVPAVAQTATPDSVFVVRNGRIFSAYEVGKDVDNITFAKKQVAPDNSVVVDGETIEMKSSLVMQQDGMMYAILSADEGLTTMDEIFASSAYLMVVMTPDLLGEDLDFESFADQHPDSYFQVTYVDAKKMEEDDNYEPVEITSDDWADYYANGSLAMDIADKNLTLNLAVTPNDGVSNIAVNYNGTFTSPVSDPYYFNVDDTQSKTRAVFAQKEADGVTFYITSGNIDKASDLANCHYYARLFVPNSAMDGNDIDLQGNTQYELELHDQVTDVNNPQTFLAANGKAADATGYVSVLDRGDGSYTLVADVENLGQQSEKRSLQFYYKGTPMEYDLTIPSQYAVGEGTPVDLKSAAYTVDDATGLYTIYLSSKANVTTLEGMADADVVITVPNDFVNDDKTHGFSGDETNALMSVSFGGDKYCQATTSTAETPIALGGNAKATFNAGKANIDFAVFGMKKFDSHSLQGHYEGSITRLN